MFLKFTTMNNESDNFLPMYCIQTIWVFFRIVDKLGQKNNKYFWNFYNKKQYSFAFFISKFFYQ